MAAVLLFWNTNMAAVTSCENALLSRNVRIVLIKVVLTSRSFTSYDLLILFLGLDASSSLELLNHLNLVAESGRLVILTIHQPRLEIFHLFHKILFLCDGQVRLR